MASPKLKVTGKSPQGRRLERAATEVVNRSCLGCRHFEISLGSPGYSQCTPGSEGSVTCDKQVFDRETLDRISLKDIVVAGFTCKQYEHAADRD